MLGLFLSIMAEWPVISKPSPKCNSTDLKSSLVGDPPNGLPFQDRLLGISSSLKELSVLEVLNSDNAVSYPSVVTQQPAISRLSSNNSFTNLTTYSGISQPKILKIQDLAVAIIFFMDS